jgi:hypothetical protein
MSAVDAVAVRELEREKDKEGGDAELRSKIDILNKLCSALHEEIVYFQEIIDEYDGENMEQDQDIELDSERSEQRKLLASLKATYDAACVATLSRMLQNVYLRAEISRFLLALPEVPRSCLYLLKLLLHTGSKGTGAGTSVRDRLHQSSTGQEAEKNKGTRSESLLLLGQVVFSKDAAAGQAALNQLLWCCISSDFETRTKVIHLIVQ